MLEESSAYGLIDQSKAGIEKQIDKLENARKSKKIMESYEEFKKKNDSILGN